MVKITTHKTLRELEAEDKALKKEIISLGKSYRYLQNKCESQRAETEELKAYIEDYKEALKLTTEQRDTSEARWKKLEEINEEEFAELSHKEYEKASLAYGWKTQEKCRTNFSNLPEANRKTMIATATQVKLWLLKQLSEKREVKK